MKMLLESGDMHDNIVYVAMDGLDKSIGKILDTYSSLQLRKIRI